MFTKEQRILWALKMWGGGGIGYETCVVCYYTPLYEKGIKKTQNKSMETTALGRALDSGHVFQFYSIYFHGLI